MNEHSLKSNLPARIQVLPGVKSIHGENDMLAVEFSDGVTANVVASTIAKFFGRTTFDVHLPSEFGPQFASSVALEKSPEEVVQLLNTLAEKAVASRG